MTSGDWLMSPVAETVSGCQGRGRLLWSSRAYRESQGQGDRSGDADVGSRDHGSVQRDVAEPGGQDRQCLAHLDAGQPRAEAVVDTAAEGELGGALRGDVKWCVTEGTGLGVGGAHKQRDVGAGRDGYVVEGEVEYLHGTGIGFTGIPPDAWWPR